MKKNYIYLILLLVGTVFVTLLFADIYNNEENKLCYLYGKLNKITSEEFTEYIMENPDSIIYIADKSNITNNKIEKKFISKLEKLGLIENIVYFDKEEISSSIKKTLSEKYSYNYKESQLPVILVIIDSAVIDIAQINEDSNVDTIIDYGVFE